MAARRRIPLPFVAAGEDRRPRSLGVCINENAATYFVESDVAGAVASTKPPKKPRVSPPPYTIVVGVDTTRASDHLLAEALAMARARPRATVHVVHGLAARARGRSATDIRRIDAVLDRGSKELREYLDGVRSRVNTQGRALVGHVRLAAPTKALVQVAIDVDADLVVVSEEQHEGLSKLIQRSTGARMLAQAPCSVLVLRSREARVKSPQIERACAKCVAVRVMTDSAKWWCPRHTKKRPPLEMHVFEYESSHSFRTSSAVGGH